MMAKTRSPERTINLLPQEEFEKNPIGKFFKWALSIGRYIIIFTELIVVISFISRFKIDSDLSRLNKDISEKQAVITSFGDLEKNVRSLQTRLKIIQSRKEANIKTVQVLDECSRITPPDVILSDLSIKESSISLKGVAISHQGLASFIEGFKQSKLFAEIDLKNILSKGESLGIQFEITAKLT